MAHEQLGADQQWIGDVGERLGPRLREPPDVAQQRDIALAIGHEF